MYRLFKFSLIFVFLLLVSSFICALSVDSFSVEPSTYYTDSNELYLISALSNLSNISYNLILTTNSNFNGILNQEIICDTVLRCDSLNTLTNTYYLAPSSTPVNGILKYHFLFNSIANRTSDSFTLDLAPNTCQPGNLTCRSIKTQSFEVHPGNPTFTLSIYDLNSSKTTTDLTKYSIAQVKLLDIWDNEDDKYTTQVYCEYYIDDVPKANNSGNVTNEELQELILGSFDAKTQTAGSHTLKVMCKDGPSTCNPNTDCLSTTVDLPFTISDQKTTVDNINFNPTTLYPDTKIKCLPSISDADDPVQEGLEKYTWKINSSPKTETSSEFNCSTYGCKSRDTVSCTVDPNTGNVVTKTGTINVSSHFTEVKISAPYKVQVNQEETYTANVNYDGTGTVTYSWSFGDGTTGTGKSVKHTYTTKGNYSVTLNVSDSLGSTGSASAQVSTVDADLIITIKSPTLNQELVKGDTLTVKATLTDNTGTPVSDGNVIANLKSGDKIFGSVQLKSSLGIYEGSLPISYLTSSTLELEIVASYTKSGVSLTNKKIVPVTSSPIDSLQPIFDFDLKYVEPKEDSFTVGNIINTIKVCFRLPDNSFDDAMSGKLVISASKDLEFKLEELQDKCYNLYPAYKILKEDLDTGITLKFKDTKDLYENYIKASNVKRFTVNALPKVFDLVLIEPSSEKTNYGQTVYVKAKPVIRTGFDVDVVKELKGQILYAGQTYDLSFDDLNSEKIFSGSFMPNLESQVKFTVFVSGTYKGTLVEESVSKTLNATNELKVFMLSPNESGVIDSLGKIIVSVNYQNNTPYENDTLTLNLNDKNTLFTKITDGKYAGAFVADSPDVGFFKSGPLALKGQDSKGNGINYSVDVPTMSWKIPMFVYDIFAGIIIVIVLMAIVMTRLSSKTRKLEKMYANKSSDELQDELTVAKQTLGELQRKFFKQEVSEDVFKTQKIELEKKVQLLESKLKVEDMHEQKVHEVSRDFVENKMSEDKKEMLEKKLNFQSESYAKYKEDIDTISAKLKPFKDKYSPDDIRVAIKQSKELPEDVVDKIISKIFD